MNKKTLLLILLAAGAMAALTWWAMRNQQAPTSIGAPTPSSLPVPLWSNKEEWEIRRGDDGSITSIAVHREVNGAAR